MPPPFLQLQLGFGAGLAHDAHEFEVEISRFRWNGAFPPAQNPAGERRHEEGTNVLVAIVLVGDILVLGRLVLQR